MAVNKDSDISEDGLKDIRSEADNSTAVIISQSNNFVWLTVFFSRLSSLCMLKRKVSKKSLKKSINKRLSRVTDNVIEIDAGEPPPIDDSLFFDCHLDTAKYIKIDGLRFQSAMLSKIDISEVKALLETGADMSEDENEQSNADKCKPSADRKNINVAYHWACHRDLVHLLKKLEKRGADPDYVDPATGMNAILVASLNNSTACLKYLLDNSVDANYVSKTINYTPLHFAAFGQALEAAELLLNYNADVNSSNYQEYIEPVLHCAIRAKADKVVKLLLDRGASVAQKNSSGETPLHVSCFVQSITCAEFILRTPGTDPNAVDHNSRSPLHYAVMNSKSSPELVELLIKFGASVNLRDKSSMTPLHIAALNEQSQCVEALVWAGADVSSTTNTGLTALNIMLRKMPESLQIFRQKLDASIRLSRPVPHNREFQMNFHFDLLFPSGNQCETSFINTFVQEHQKDLLSHPLVMAFLHLKWEKIRKLYLLRIFLYALTVMCLTIYVLSALAYKCYNLNEENSSKICNSKRDCYFLFRREIIEIEWYLAVLLTCIMIPRKIFGFAVYKSVKQYFSNIDNVLDNIVIVSIFVTSFIYTGRTYDWQKYVGAFAILCAWTNLMLMVGQLPAFGTYVAMFTHIQFEFAKLLLAYSGLLIGFTISFCVIFVGEPSFGNPFTGLIKVLSMMAGELDFEGLIEPDAILPDGSFVIYHPLSVCPQILFTLFIVFVTVILMNLLVGIAVHDIQGLRKHASLTKLVRQTKLIIFTEMVLYNGKLPYAFKKWLSDHRISVDNHKKVLVVKPLNPLEKSLPKDVIKAAYEIAQKNSTFCSEDNISCEHITWMQHDDDDSDDCVSMTEFDTEIRTAEDEIKIVKKHILNTNKMLQNLAEKLHK